MLFELNIEIKACDLQTPYMHIHHAESIKLLERARLDYIDSIGFSAELFFERNLFLVISDIDVSYKREIKAGQIRVTCDDVIFDEKRICIFQSIYNEKGKHAIRAKVTTMVMNGKTKRAVFPEADFVKALKNNK